jgi:hypothetical protein
MQGLFEVVGRIPPPPPAEKPGFTA